MRPHCADCAALGRVCDHHRRVNRRNRILSLVRRGAIPMRRCFRCLSIHPMPRTGGERYCKLAAEHTGWPFTEEAA